MSVQASGLVTAQFTGNNGAGAISVPGLQVGDIVVAFQEGAGMVAQFESSVSVADQLHQFGGGDMSAQTLHAILFRGTFS